MGEGENSPSCLHALGLGQGMAKQPRTVRCPASFLKRQSAPLTSPSRPAARHGTPASRRCEIRGGGATSLPGREHSPSHAAGDAKGHPKRVCRRPWVPPGTLSPTHSVETGQRDEGRLGRCRSQPGSWERRRRGDGFWGAATAGGHCTGTERGLPGLGSHCPERRAITGPLSGAKEASVFILCRKKLLFYCR